MKSPSLKAVTEVTCLAPQFLVDDLSEAIGYYRDQLGFEPDFVYESFYASVSRDGFSIHLKCAPKTLADRTHRKQNERLDAYVGVRGIEALFDECKLLATVHDCSRKSCTVAESLPIIIARCVTSHGANELKHILGKQIFQVHSPNLDRISIACTERKTTGGTGITGINQAER